MNESIKGINRLIKYFDDKTKALKNVRSTMILMNGKRVRRKRRGKREKKD